MEEDSGVEYVVWHEGIVLQRSTTFDSWARFRLPPGGNRDVVMIWGPANTTVRFRRRLHVDALLRDGSRRAVECRLEALGYAAGHGDDDKFVEALTLFQEDYGLPNEPVSADEIPASVRDALASFFERELKAPRADGNAPEEEEAADE